MRANNKNLQLDGTNTCFELRFLQTLSFILCINALSSALSMKLIMFSVCLSFSNSKFVNALSLSIYIYIVLMCKLIVSCFVFFIWKVLFWVMWFDVDWCMSSDSSNSWFVRPVSCVHCFKITMSFRKQWVMAMPQ